MRAATVLLLGCLASSCGGAGGEIVPSPEELASSLLVTADLGGEWAVPADIEAPSGVLTDEIVESLPFIDLCPDAGAEAITTAAGLRWQAGMGFVLGEPTEGFAPNLIELLLAGDPADTAAAFAVLKAGVAACLDVESFVPDAGTLISVDLTVPPVGDDRFGVWTRQTDQPDGNPRWDLRQVFVRQGAVILWLQDVEINPTADPVVPGEELERIVVAAVDRLP